MIVVSRKRLREFWQKHPDARNALLLWEQRVKAADWQTFHDLNQDFVDADQIGDERIVFNIRIRGNHYRLVAIIKIRNHRVYVRWIGTHKAYDKINVLEV